MKYIYVSKEEAIKGNSLVYAVSDEKIVDYKEVLGEDSVEFFGDNLPYSLFYDVKTDTVREADNYTKFMKGDYQLHEGEYISGESIVEVVNDNSFIEPVFNEVTHLWEEGVPLELIEQGLRNEIISCKLRIRDLEYIEIFKDVNLISHLEELEKKHSEISMEISFEENNNEQS